MAGRRGPGETHGEEGHEQGDEDGGGADAGHAEEEGPGGEAGASAGDDEDGGPGSGDGRPGGGNDGGHLTMNRTAAVTRLRNGMWSVATKSTWTECFPGVIPFNVWLSP